MIAILYEPTGQIIQTVRGSESAVVATAQAMSLDWLPVPTTFSAVEIDRLDVTHVVADGGIEAMP